MRAVDVIARKRDGGEHPSEEMSWLVDGVVSGEVADYQAAAWLMAVYLRGMSAGETVDLTKAMAASGRTLDLGDIAPRAVDKHSTGGVGDKISLVAVPLAAAVGVAVPKMSGRGLGITGGTLDKLESIPGLRISLTDDEMLRQVREVGLVIAGQTADLAPADGKLYALRDVTATVGSLPLIVSSILSKKLAGGAPAIVLDVKAGRGAFMSTVAAAEELARGLVETGRACGRRVVAYVSNMDQPLGRAVGNAVEVAEAIATLHGDGPEDLQTLAMTLASEMAQQAGVAADADDARRLVQDALTSGAALAKLRAMIAAQGGDARVIDDPGRLPTAPVVVVVTAPRDSYVADLDAGIVGQTLLALGAGRAKKTDPVDHRVGAIFHRKVGDRVTEGERLFTLHLADEARLADAREPILGAYGFSDDPVPSPRIVIRRIGEI